MRLLITGICGFVGSTLAKAFLEADPQIEITGIDNFIRPGSETNRPTLEALGIKVIKGDIRFAAGVDALPKSDWIIDAAANPSVLAGVDGATTPRDTIDHNLGGTINLIEACRRNRSGFILLSTSRVYSIAALAAVPVTLKDKALVPTPGDPVHGLSEQGVAEDFSTAAPVSLYGATKLASEALALEYGAAFDFPVFINRCGVLAGAGQFGRADQGIFSYWINSHLRRRPLTYLGFGGTGAQVRDCLHPRDLLPVLKAQMAAPKVPDGDRIVNLGGGIASAFSLRQLTDWCDTRFGAHPVASDPRNRAFDIPWMVLDSGKARRLWKWSPSIGLDAILEEIADHAVAHPRWLELSAPKA